MSVRHRYIGIWFWLCKHVFILMPASLFYKFVFWVNCKRLGCRWYSFDLENPETFNEKLNLLKLHDRNPLAPVVADKVSARKYVADTIGEKHLIPLIGIYKSTVEMDFAALPKSFALKTSHGSGWNLICLDKTKLNWKSETIRFNHWLNRNAYYLSREWQYKEIEPRLICEQMLAYNIKDFKFLCFNGNPEYIQVDMNRNTGEQRRTLFTRDWQETDIQLNYPKSLLPPDKPTLLSEMLEIARKLSKPFTFCRVDLYEHDNQIYFGEITIHPGGGVEPFLKKEQDTEFGKSIDLDFLKY